MFQFLFRSVGFVVLAFALVLAVLDITRSITASKIILTPLGVSWANISPKSLQTAQEALSNWLHPLVWDPGIVTALALPSWLAFWLIAMILLWMGQKRTNPYGRFASR